jgi:hypothetical protein
LRVVCSSMLASQRLRACVALDRLAGRQELQRRRQRVVWRAKGIERERPGHRRSCGEDLRG